MLMQRAAARHVHELEPAADGQDRHPSLLRSAEQGELPRVAVGTRGVGERMPLRTVQLGLHVESAREDEPVESVQHGRGRGIRSRLRREQHRDAARRGHRVEVLLRQERGAHVPHALLRLLEVGGEADDRAGDRELSESFEATHPLPIRHGGVVGLDLDARLVQVVVDHLVAEGRAGDRRTR